MDNQPDKTTFVKGPRRYNHRLSKVSLLSKSTLLFSGIYSWNFLILSRSFPRDPALGQCTFVPFYSFILKLCASITHSFWSFMICYCSYVFVRTSVRVNWLPRVRLSWVHYIVILSCSSIQTTKISVGWSLICLPNCSSRVGYFGFSKI